jgi:hypothetical protein
MSVQIIERDGQPEWAIVPYEEYLQLLEQAEMLEDIRDYDAVKSALERGEEELIPAEVVYAILDGVNPIKVWRDFRGLTQQELAEKRKGSLRVLGKIAGVLKVDLEDIVATQ